MKAFNALIKPASSLCNMRCAYCFYTDVAEQRSIPSYGIMNESTARTIIDRIFEYIRSKPDYVVIFAFQGGEPTLSGIDFFRFFIDYVNSRKGEINCTYSLQTNGLLIDADWCKLFHNNNFLIGLSYDGMNDLHDMHRVDAFGKGTSRKLNEVMRLFNEYNVQYNILSVITKETTRRAKELYKSYKRNGLNHIQLIPCLKPLNAQKCGKYDLDPKQYAEFMKTLYSLWLEDKRKGNSINIRHFDNIEMLLNGQTPEQCGMHGSCTPQFVVEADGSVFPCDFYVLDEYKCGSVQENTINEISHSCGMKAFLNMEAPISPMCEKCEVHCLCHGGCKRYRSFYNETDSFCPNKELFLHVEICNQNQYY